MHIRYVFAFLSSYLQEINWLPILNLSAINKIEIEIMIKRAVFLNDSEGKYVLNQIGNTDRRHIN